MPELYEITVAGSGDYYLIARSIDQAVARFRAEMAVPESVEVIAKRM